VWLTPIAEPVPWLKTKLQVSSDERLADVDIVSAFGDLLRLWDSAVPLLGSYRGQPERSEGPHTGRLFADFALRDPSFDCEVPRRLRDSG
jgi:hypothetical protein